MLLVIRGERESHALCVCMWEGGTVPSAEEKAPSQTLEDCFRGLLERGFTPEQIRKALISQVPKS